MLGRRPRHLAVAAALLCMAPAGARAVTPTVVAAALLDANPARRSAAAQAIVAAGRSAVRWLTGSLGHPDYRVRRRACRLILRIGDERALPWLLDLVHRDDPSADVRAAAAWVAYRLGHEPALATVEGELGNPFWHRRLNAVADLAALGDAGAGPWLARALSDRSWLVRLRAIEGLRSIDARPYASAVLGRMSDPVWHVRSIALETLLSLGSAPGVEESDLDGVLVTALFDPVARVRRRAARAVAALGAGAARVAVAARFSLANDPDPRVRADLLRAVAADPDTRDGEVQAALGDESWLVRVTAAVALSARGKTVPARRLLADLDGLAPEETDLAARALAQLPDRDSVATLARLAAGRTDAGAAARRLLVALARLGDPWAADVLASARRLLGDRSEGSRIAGAEIAGRLGDGRIGPALVPLLLDPSAAVFAAAARALRAVAPRLDLDQRVSAAKALALRPDGAIGALHALVQAGLPPDALATLAVSRSAAVRALAVRTLGSAGLGSAVVLAALRDPDASVRAAAAGALAATLPPQASEPVAGLAALAPPRDERATVAVRAALGESLADPAPEVRLAAARALRELGDPRGQPELRRALARELGRSDPIRRGSAARELEHLARAGDREAAAALVPALVDPDPATRRVASRVLGEGEVPEALRAAAREGSTPLRWAASLVLARRGETGPLSPLAALTPREVERIGEFHPARLADALAARLPDSIRRAPGLRRFLSGLLAPDLLEDLARFLARDVVTSWRGSPPYNMRRQNLFNAEVSAAVRHYPGLHPRVLKSLLYQESNLEPLAGNRFDCVGLAAFCRGAGAEEGLRVADLFQDFEGDDRYRPALAILAAVRHLRRKATLLEEGPFARFGAPVGDDYWAFVLAAYNGGHEQVAQAMEAAYERGLELAKARRLRGARAEEFARAHARRWDNLLVPDEVLEDSPLYEMTERRYPWYRPYGRYRRMRGAEAKYHEIGQFPLDVLERAFEGMERPRREPG